MVVSLEVVGINNSLSYKEIPVRIMDRYVCWLRMKEVASVNVLWSNQMSKEATWEAEEDIKSKYPHLFSILEVCDRGMC